MGPFKNSSNQIVRECSRACVCETARPQSVIRANAVDRNILGHPTGEQATIGRQRMGVGPSLKSCDALDEFKTFQFNVNKIDYPNRCRFLRRELNLGCECVCCVLCMPVHLLCGYF